MKIILYGATGNAGRRILAELLLRGHEPSAVVRDTSKVPPAVVAVQDDLQDVAKISAIVEGSDAVVSAYKPPMEDTDQLVGVTERLVEAVRRSRVPRLVMVGGAGLLEIAPGVTLLQGGDVPEFAHAIIRSHARALEVLQGSGINWTYFAPPALFEAGRRTGKFRLGTKSLVVDERNESRISFEDYAAALVNELESPAYERRQLTIGY